MALGYGDVPGLDVSNTFAPVVKGVTVRLLIALAQIRQMHIHQLLKKFERFLGSKSWIQKYPLPANAAALLGQTEDDLTAEDLLDLQNFPYRSFIGAVLYLSMNTRPDIAYAVGVLSRYASKPTIE